MSAKCIFKWATKSFKDVSDIHVSDPYLSKLLLYEKTENGRLPMPVRDNCQRI